MEERQKHARDLRVEALNHALRDIPVDRVRYHVCFGSWHVPHTCDAPLEEIIDLVLEVNAGAYLIEAANPRHEHEYQDSGAIFVIHANLSKAKVYLRNSKICTLKEGEET